MAVRYGFRRPGDGDDFEDLAAEDLLEYVLDELLEYGDLDSVLDRLAY
jgi:acetyl-CoA acetyltransferase